MQKILALVHLKGSSLQHYDNFAKDQINAAKHLLGERLYHFVSIRDDEVLIADVWKSAEVFSKYIDILMPLAIQNGFTPKAEINNLYPEIL
jgi:hypothetical protein